MREPNAKRAESAPESVGFQVAGYLGAEGFHFIPLISFSVGSREDWAKGIDVFACLGVTPLPNRNIRSRQRDTGSPVWIARELGDCFRVDLVEIL